MHGLISGFSILLHCSIFLFFVPVPYCFDDCSMVIQSKVREFDSSRSFVSIGMFIPRYFILFDAVVKGIAS